MILGPDKLIKKSVAARLFLARGESGIIYYIIYAWFPGTVVVVNFVLNALPVLDGMWL